MGQGYARQKQNAASKNADLESQTPRCKPLNPRLGCVNIYFNCSLEWGASAHLSASPSQQGAFLLILSETAPSPSLEIYYTLHSLFYLV